MENNNIDYKINMIVDNIDMFKKLSVILYMLHRSIVKFFEFEMFLEVENMEQGYHKDIFLRILNKIHKYNPFS